MHPQKDLAILFIVPPSLSFARPIFRTYLGTGYIIAYLIQNGFRAGQFITENPVRAGECVREILRRKPRALGFTVYDTNYGQCRLLADAVRGNDKEITILFGGPTPSVQPDLVLAENPSVDICVRHEGEETTLELLSLLEGNGFDRRRTPLTKVKGITYRSGSEIISNPDRNVFWNNRHIPDYLDAYPSPYLSGVIQSADAGLITARGCDQHCIFCNCAVLSRRRVTTHSVDRVVEEMERISRLPGGGTLTIFDDAFTLMPKRALAICNRIIENKIRISIDCITRCDRVDEELLTRMKEAGFQAVGFSLESASPRVLRILGKVQAPDTARDDGLEKEKEFVEAFRRNVVLAKKVGIERVYASIMVGMPGETPQEAGQTIELIRSLSEYLESYVHNVFAVFPGTPIFNACGKYGLEVQRAGTTFRHKTVHAFDVDAIVPAPKATVQTENARDHAKVIGSFSLDPLELEGKDSIFTIFLQADRITKEHVFWLQECLAFNGNLVILYSNVGCARQNHEENLEVLWTYHSPVTFPHAYYRSRRADGGVTLTSYKLQRYDEAYRIPIEIIGAGTWLSDPTVPIPPRQCLCVENEKSDTDRLFEFLERRSLESTPAADLWKSEIHPYFAGLCRWETAVPNCRTLDVLFVEPDGRVKTCWNGRPVGRVGMPLEEIERNMMELAAATAGRRDCKACPKEQECAKCIFPDPISESEYCDRKKRSATEVAADLMRATDLFKEMLPPADDAEPVPFEAVAVWSTYPEPLSDLEAQIRSMMNPAHARDSVWIAKGSPLPDVLPAGAEVIRVEDGVLLTTNPEKARLFRESPTDETRSEILGYEQTKARVLEAIENGETLHAVFAEDEKGNRIHEEVVTSSHLANATRKLEAQGLSPGVENPSRTMRRRAALAGAGNK